MNFSLLSLSIDKKQLFEHYSLARLLPKHDRGCDLSKLHYSFEEFPLMQTCETKVIDGGYMWYSGVQKHATFQEIKFSTYLRWKKNHLYVQVQYVDCTVNIWSSCWNIYSEAGVLLIQFLHCLRGRSRRSWSMYTSACSATCHLVFSGEGPPITD